jgi:hypothetical protein
MCLLQRHQKRGGNTEHATKLMLKGQLILKCLFGILNSPEKRTKFFDFITTSSRIVVIHFFGRIGDTKKTFRN